MPNISIPTVSIMTRTNSKLTTGYFKDIKIRLFFISRSWLTKHDDKRNKFAFHITKLTIKLLTPIIKSHAYHFSYSLNPWKHEWHLIPSDHDLRLIWYLFNHVDWTIFICTGSHYWWFTSQQGSHWPEKSGKTWKHQVVR